MIYIQNVTKLVLAGILLCPQVSYSSDIPTNSVFLNKITTYDKYVDTMLSDNTYSSEQKSNDIPLITNRVHTIASPQNQNLAIVPSCKVTKSYQLSNTNSKPVEKLNMRTAILLEIIKVTLACLENCYPSDERK